MIKKNVLSILHTYFLIYIRKNMFGELLTESVENTGISIFICKLTRIWGEFIH